MQKPFTSASVGKGRAASLLYRSQPRFTMRIASSASLILVNSSTSAPATNPDSFAERTTSPRGFCPESSSTMPSSSAITSAESTFAEASALSIESQTIPSLSVSSFQLRYASAMNLHRPHQQRPPPAFGDGGRRRAGLGVGRLEGVQQVEHDARAGGAY